MKTSKHADKRIRQRGIPSDVVDMIVTLGDYEVAPGGVFRCKITKRVKQNTITHLKSIISLLERSCGKELIMDGDSIITVYHKTN